MTVLQHDGLTNDRIKSTVISYTTVDQEGKGRYLFLTFQ